MPLPEKKTVLVAGGGIGGMQAALTASRRGHRVILCEKTDALGGVLLCERNVPFKKHLHEYIEHQALMLTRSPVELRLNTEVTPELARAISPDVIIAALGSKPYIPDIKGIDGGNVVVAEDLYISPEKAGKKIVVLGGGLVGAELAIYMAGRGHKVTIIEMLPALSNGGNLLQGQSIAIEIDKLGIELALGTKALEIKSDGVLCEDADGTRLFEADTVVCAVGMTPLRSAADKLRFEAPEFYQIGDCVAPGNIAAATRTAYFAANNIGRILT